MITREINSFLEGAAKLGYKAPASFNIDDILSGYETKFTLEKQGKTYEIEANPLNVPGERIHNWPDIEELDTLLDEIYEEFSGSR